MKTYSMIMYRNLYKVESFRQKVNVKLIPEKPEHVIKYCRRKSLWNLMRDKYHFLCLHELQIIMIYHNTCFLLEIIIYHLYMCPWGFFEKHVNAWLIKLSFRGNTIKITDWRLASIFSFWIHTYVSFSIRHRAFLLYLIM